MKSGIYWGYVGLIEGLVERIQREYGQPMRVVATGGLAPIYAEATSVIARAVRCRPSTSSRGRASCS